MARKETIVTVEVTEIVVDEGVEVVVDAVAIAPVPEAAAVEEDLGDLPATGQCQGLGPAVGEGSREESLDQNQTEKIMENKNMLIIQKKETLDHVGKKQMLTCLCI